MAAGQRRFISIQPLDEWPGKRRSGDKSPFRAGFTDTLDKIEYELSCLGAMEPTLQTMHSQDDVRVDGRLKTDTRKPSYQGVILTFKRKAKQHEHACDLCKQGKQRSWIQLKESGYAFAHPTGETGKYFVCKDQKPKPVEFRFPADKYADWKDNVRAIAMVLEGLRMIERHGVKSEAQYAGYKALPPADLKGETTRRTAAMLLASYIGHPSDYILEASGDELDKMYKAAAQRAHPDKGGSAEAFHKLTEAVRVLRGTV